MKIKILCLLLIFTACSTQKYSPASSAIEAASEFIDACKMGEFKKANYYMLQDAENANLLKQAKNKFLTFSLEEKRQLVSASLQNISIENISPTEVIVYYNISSENERRKVKAVLNNNQWLVDFKSSFNPNL